MGIWNFYFIAKLFLYGARLIDFHVAPNLLFATLLAIPLSRPRLRQLRQIIAIPIGIALLYHDTWFPPASRVLTQASQLGGFSFAYLAELAGRLFNPLIVAGLVILYVVYFFAAKKFRGITPFVFVAILAPLAPLLAPPSKTHTTAGVYRIDDASTPGVATISDEVTTPQAHPDTASPQPVPMPGGPVPRPGTVRFAPQAAKKPHEPAIAGGTASAPPAEAELTASLNSFYRREATRKVTFATKDPNTPFDIIFLQICSLSWDDLDFTGERDNPLFKRFDIVFTSFNSAATYSGPSVVRLLRSSCGHPRHSALYEPFSPQCLTFNNLQQIGFEPQLAMNHDGRFGGFLADVRERGGMRTAPFDAKGAPPYLQSFDRSPIHDDYTVLSKWWEKRTQAPSGQIALFYNSVSLHDGNRYADGRPGNSLETYHSRLTRLLGDLGRFFTDLQSSGRRAVVVLVPEHGAAVRGDKMQIAGMREIPSPRISIVPVGIKLIGLPENSVSKPLMVSKPASYLALSQLLADFIHTPPFDKKGLDLEKRIRDLPSTEFVAENDDVVVQRRGRQYFIRSRDSGWIEYDPT